MTRISTRSHIVWIWLLTGWHSQQLVIQYYRAQSEMVVSSSLKKINNWHKWDTVNV
jgi:hypothetical protein